MRIRLLIFLLIMLSAGFIRAQFSLESSYNSVNTGWNQNLMLKHQWNRISVSAGYKYHINRQRTFPRPQMEMYRKSFWADAFKEHSGFELGVQVKLLQKENFDLFGFYQFQYTKAQLRHEVYYYLYPLVNPPQSEYDVAYERVLHFIHPVRALEHNLGLGLNIYFTDHFYLTSKIGAGLVFYKETDPWTIILGGGGLNFSEHLSGGLGWKFG